MRPGEGMPARTLRAASWAVVLILIVLAYYPSLEGDFLQEDFGLVNLTEDGRLSLEKTLRYFFPTHLGDFSFFRPLPVMSAAVDFYFWGVDPFGFHLTNLLIHLVSALLVGVTAGRIARSRWAAPAAAAFYGLYPGNAEAVVWLEQRMVGLSIVFLFLCLSLHARRKLRPMAWMAALGALLCKESSVVLPAVVFLFQLALPDNRRFLRRLASAIRAVVPYVGVLAVYFTWRYLVYGRLDTGYATHETTLGYFLSHKIYLEIPMTLLRFLSPVNSTAAPVWIVVAHAVLVASGVVILALRWRRSWRSEGPLLGFGLVVMALAFAVSTPNLRVDGALANSRLFSPAAAGMAMMIAASLAGFTRRGLILTAAGLCLYCLVLPINIKPYLVAGKCSRDIRKGIEAQAAGYDPSVRVVVTGVPHKVGGVVLFVDGLMLKAALSPPFTQRKISIVPLIQNQPGDPDGLMLCLAGQRALLAVEIRHPEGAARVQEVAGPQADWRYPTPETIQLHAPAENASIRIAENPRFVFSSGQEYAYYRLVFRTNEFTFALTADRESRISRDADGRLVYRLSAGDVLQRGSFLDGRDAGGIAGAVDWWVEGVNDYTIPRSAAARSPVGHFVLIPGGG